MIYIDLYTVLLKYIIKIHKESIKAIKIVLEINF